MNERRFFRVALACLAIVGVCVAARPAVALYFHSVYDRFMPQGAKTTDWRARDELRRKLSSTQAKEIIVELEAEHARKVAANGGKDLDWSGATRDTGNASGRPWGNHELWLEQCFNGIKPNYMNLVRWQYLLSLEAQIRGGGGGQEDREPKFIAAMKPVIDRRIGIRFDQLESRATDERLTKLGLTHLVGKSLEGIEFEQNKATIFLANKGTEACVVHVAGTKPRFRRLLENNGLAKDWLGEADGMSVAFTSKQNLSIYPARFAWPGSVNLRLVESKWKGKEFKAWWLMKGSYGIDDESVSRVQAHNDEGSAWVSKHTASPADLARLGLKSATDPFPPYPQASADEGVLASFVVGVIPWVTSETLPVDKYLLKSQAGYSAPIKLASDAWQRRVTGAGLGGRLPEQMFGSDGTGQVMRNPDATMMVGGRPSSIKTTWALYPMLNPYAYGQVDWERRVQANQLVHPEEERRITLLPPKNGVGMAQGVAEYLLQNVLPNGDRVDGVRRHYMGSAIKDPRMAVWIEAERVTDKQAQALLAPLNAKPSKSHTLAKSK